MQTRRDQLQAYRFQNRRALAALVTGEPNGVEAPMRRLTVTTLSGIMIAILVVAGFAVFGLIKPAPNDDWKANGAVIVTNETAAIFVRLDGVLHPVLNYASAVLAVSGSGSQQANVVHVDRDVLDGAKRGSTIGIPGLPTSLPSADGLVTAPFTVCSRTQAGAGTTLTTKVSVEIGDDLGSTPLFTGTGVVVRSAGDGTNYLLAGGRRLAIGSSQVATSLQLNTSQVVTVGTAFLDGVQAGTPLRTPTVPGAGTPYRSPVSGRGVSVGQLLYNTDDRRYLLVLPDGVADLTEVQARLLETLPLPPRNAIAPPVEVSRSDVIDLPQSTTTWSAVSQQFTGLPSSIPRTSAVPGQRGGVCALYRGNSSNPTLSVPPSLLPSYSLPQVSQSALSARGTADSVAVSGGKAAIVRSNDHSATTFLVAEPGRRYAAASSDVLAGFGYADVTPATIPAQLLALIPVGLALDPVAARTPVAN
ncbi:type VII secretion protein EccB [uncultured Jatrophihabitans sp.]|uniref:type VII secretion protein EccB n=1 Tax=uncultured Jatrophihabitans sp. TaxID=1610747 RepID=UPI0035C9CD28